MVGDTDEDIRLRRRGENGHRAVPHTADTRIETWGPSREACVAEAVRALAECFADLSTARAAAVRHLRYVEDRDEDLLAAVLEEAVFRLEVHGEVPVDVEVQPAGDGVEVRLAVTRLDAVPVTGALPRGVPWNELRLAPDAYGWSCGVTVDMAARPR